MNTYADYLLVHHFIYLQLRGVSLVEYIVQQQLS